jgi:hypothetical protein
MKTITFKVNDDEAHFTGLAKRHGVLLATFDQGIPDAYLIPVLPI